MSVNCVHLFAHLSGNIFQHSLIIYLDNSSFQKEREEYSKKNAYNI